MKQYLSVVALIFGIAWTDCSAQKKIIISFDSTGTLTGTFPSYMLQGDSLEFHIQTTPSDGELRRKLMTFRNTDPDVLKQELNRINKYYNVINVGVDLKLALDNSAAIALNNYHEYVLDIRIDDQKTRLPIDLNTIWPSVPKNYVVKQIYIVPYNLSAERLNFLLIRNPDNQLFYQYLKETSSFYQTTQPFVKRLRQILSDLDNVKKQIDMLKTSGFLSGTNNSSTISSQETAALRDFRMKYEKLFTAVVESNQEWLIAWSWYTDYKLKFNPFGIEMPSMDGLDDIQGQIDDAKKSLEYYDKECLLCKDKMADDKLEEKIIEKNQKYRLKQKRLDEINSKNKAYNAKLGKYNQASRVQYAGTLYLSTRKRIHWMRHHNAALDFELENKSDHPSMYSDIDEVHILTENVKSPMHLSLEQDITSYEPTSVFTDIVLPAIGGIVTSRGSLQPGGIGNVTIFYTPTDLDFRTPPNFTGLAGLTGELSNSLAPIPNDLINLKISAKIDTVLKTDIVGPSKVIQAPAIVKYSIYFKVKDVKVDLVKDLQYKIYRRTGIQPFVAPVYLPLDRTTAKYDETSQSFSDVSLGQYDLIAGIKIFPYRSNVESKHADKQKYKRIQSPHILRGNHWLVNNLSLSVAVGTQQNALENWFFGMAYDVIKGLAINTGVNLYSSKHYNIQNGIVISSTSKFTPTWYVGFGVDPIVVAKSLGLFKPK